jgi:predicted Zn finger-like uncharacterized protein
MALATRCPNCHALFRVVADQLKLRGGLVRCGACRHVFDAIGTLSYIDDAVLSTAGQPAAGGPAPPVHQPAGGASGVAAFASQAVGQIVGTTPMPATSGPPAPAAAREAGLSPAAPFDETDRHAADAPTTTSVTDMQPVAVDRDKAVPLTPEDVRPATVEETVEPALEQSAAPDFLREEASHRSRGFSVLFGGGAVLMLVLALAQLVEMFRADILAKVPAARPALTQLCKVFRCTVNWPARGEMLAVVGSELQVLPGTSVLELSAVVRNRGSVTLALPAIELTLTDTMNRTVARKVFAPIDYLAGEANPQTRLLAGLEPGADLTIKIAFEARGLNAAGFVVYPFYL